MTLSTGLCRMLCARKGKYWKSQAQDPCLTHHTWPNATVLHCLTVSDCLVLYLMQPGMQKLLTDMHGTQWVPVVDLYLSGSCSYMYFHECTGLKCKAGHAFQKCIAAKLTSPRLCPPVAMTLWNAPVTRRRTAARSTSLSSEDLYSPIKPECKLPLCSQGPKRGRYAACHPLKLHQLLLALSGGAKVPNVDAMLLDTPETCISCCQRHQVVPSQPLLTRLWRKGTQACCTLTGARL